MDESILPAVFLLAVFFGLIWIIDLLELAR